jgi:catechol 1,2-dioxygenase
MEAPRVENGGTIIRSPTPGEPIYFTGWVRDTKGAAIANADIDVWQPSPTGLYENQDPSQAEFNLRGRFRTDEKGMFAFRSIKPGYYPIPVDGPVGDLLRAQNRQPYRPAHLHCLIYKEGFKTIASQIYNPDDPYLQIDAQFGVTPALMGKYVLHKDGTPPAPDMKAPWYTIEHTFVLEAGVSRLPTPPVSAKAKTTEGVTLS